MQIITDETQKELKTHGSYQFPFLLSHERLSAYEKGFFLWHWHPEVELTLVTEGKMRYQINDRSLLISEGQALFCNTCALHTGEKADSQDCTYLSLTFDPRLIYGYENSLIYQQYVKPVLQDMSLSSIFLDGSALWHREAILSLQRLIKQAEHVTPFSELDIQIGLQQLWRQIFSHVSPNEDTNFRKRRDFERIREILLFLETHYTERLTLEEIAAHIHMCSGECCRLFKRYMNTTLFAFLLQYRIEKSLPYLVSGNYTITEIADMTGFCDSNYYTKIFRRMKGCTPSEYRKKGR